MNRITRGAEEESNLARGRSRWNEPTSAFAGIITSLFAVAALYIVRMSGGASSNFLALLYLPVVLSVLACRFYCTVGIGAALALLSPFVMHPAVPGITGSDVIRGFIIVSVAAIGAAYARETKRERNSIRSIVLEQDAVLSASQVINAAARLEDAVSSFLSLIPEYFEQADCAAIFFMEDNSRWLELYDCHGLPKEDIKLKKITLSECGMRRISLPMDPIVVFDDSEQVYTALVRLNPDASSALAIPLNSPDPSRPPIGLLYISSQEVSAFTSAHGRLLRDLAEGIAPSFQQFRVQEGLAGLAFTDGLTGLYNFRYFSQQLEEEIRRVDRYARPLSLILLDLDNFKSVNDLHGHPVGDRLLANVAATIRAHVRDTDCPARYGGEEFAVICPETRIEEACALGERIRAAVEQSRLSEESAVDLKATVSIGIATSPDDGPTVAELVVAADAALYQAKRSGKNRVIASQSAPELIS